MWYATLPRGGPIRGLSVNALYDDARSQGVSPSLMRDVHEDVDSRGITAPAIGPGEAGIPLIARPELAPTGAARL